MEPYCRGLRGGGAKEVKPVRGGWILKKREGPSLERNVWRRVECF